MQKKIMKMLSKALFLIFILTNLTGCFNYREINKITFATSIIFDVDEHNNVVLYLDCVTPYRNANESSDKGRRIVFKGNGKTALEAIRDVNVSSSNKLNFTQVRAYIFTEDAARAGIKNYLDLINNDQQFNFKPYMFVYMGDVKALIDVANNDEEYLGLYLDKLIEKNKGNGKVIKANVNDYITKTLTADNYGFMSVIGLKKEDIETKIELNGGAIMQNNKMVDKLEKDDTLIYNILTSNIKEGTFEVPNPKEKSKYVTLDILEETNKTDVEMLEDEILLKKDIQIRVSIGEIQGNLIVDSDVLKEIKLNEEANIKKSEEEFFNKYKKKNIDVLGVSRLLEMRYPNRDKANFLEKTNIDVNVNLIIDGSSLVKNSL